MPFVSSLADVVEQVDQLKRGLDFLAREHSGQATAAEIMRLAAAHPDDLDTPLPLAQVMADGWLGEFLSGAVPRCRPSSADGQDGGRADQGQIPS